MKHALEKGMLLTMVNQRHHGSSRHLVAFLLRYALQRTAVGAPFLMAAVSFVMRRVLRHLIAATWDRLLLWRITAQAGDESDCTDPFCRIPQRRSSFSYFYDTSEQLADTQFGAVYLCRPRGAFGNDHVVKIVPRAQHPLLRQGNSLYLSKMSPSPTRQRSAEETAEFLEYMRMLLKLRHENVVRYVQFLSDDTSYYFVMERCMGLPLQEHLLTKEAWCEHDTKPLMQQLLRALDYVHGLGLVHRDVKLQNIFVSYSGLNSICAKLLDFGLGCTVEHASGTVGTLGYIAPEVFRAKRYSIVADIFSTGVVFYILLSGRPPFSVPITMRCVDECIRQIQRGPDLYSAPFNMVSMAGSDLLLRMLDPEPRRRYCAGEALEHRWFKLQSDCRSEPELWQTANSKVEFLKIMGVWSGTFANSSSGVGADLKQNSILKSIDEDDDAEDFLSEKLCCNIVQGMCLSISVADPALPDCPLVAVSKGFETMTGWSESEVVGRNCRFLNKGCNIPQKLRAQLRHAVQTHTKFLGLMPNVRRDGAHFCNLLHLAPMTVGERTLSIGIQWRVPDERICSIHLDDPHQVETLQGIARTIQTSITDWVVGIANRTARAGVWDGK